MSKLAFRAQTVDIAYLPLRQDLLAKNVLMTAQRDFRLGNSPVRMEDMKDMDLEKEICSLLEKKTVFFDQYLSITERMKESFVDKKERDPRASIPQRQACINKIQKIDASMEKIMGNSSDKVHNISEKCKGMIDGYLRSLKNIMETVDLIDRELIVMVGAEGENIKTELLKLQDVRQAAKGYRDKIKSTPRFLDTIR